MKKEFKLMPIDFASVNSVTRELFVILNRINSFRRSIGHRGEVCAEIIHRFGAWRIALARLIQRECEDVVKTSFNFIDDVGELPIRIVKTKTEPYLTLIDGIEKTLNKAIGEIDRHHSAKKFKSHRTDYFYRYGLEIDLLESYIKFFSPAGSKSIKIPVGSQAYEILKLLLERRGEVVKYEEILEACDIKQSSSGPAEKGMDMFKAVAVKLKEVGIGSRRLKHFIETNKGYRLIVSESW